MPIPAGTWDITAGGPVGKLTFGAQTGPLTGTIFGEPFVGFFDETSQTLTILQNPSVASSATYKDALATPFNVYQGTLFPSFTAPDKTVIFVFSGVFLVNSGGNNVVYEAWYAQNPPPVKIGKEGKDGKDVKDGKEKEKGHFDKIPPEFQVRAKAPTSFAHPPSVQATNSDLPMGRSFIEAGERPSVGEAALQEG